MKTQAEFRNKFDLWLQENTKDLPGATDDCNCPACGDWAGEDYHAVAYFDNKSNVAASMNSGPWDAMDWQELRRCDCGVFFTTEGSNY